mgnify:CR=1 FL=1
MATMTRIMVIGEEKVNFNGSLTTSIRTPGGKDPRVSTFPREWFTEKTCLDIGCNVGLVTLDIGNFPFSFIPIGQFK